MSCQKEINYSIHRNDKLCSCTSKVRKSYRQFEVMGKVRNWVTSCTAAGSSQAHTHPHTWTHTYWGINVKSASQTTQAADQQIHFPLSTRHLTELSSTPTIHLKPWHETYWLLTAIKLHQKYSYKTVYPHLELIILCHGKQCWPHTQLFILFWICHRVARWQ